MYEEVAVWCRESHVLAVRYVGFRDLDDGKVWIAFANYLSLEDDELTSDNAYGGAAVVSEFIENLPPPGSEWKSTAAEAVRYFIANNPSD